MVIGKTFKMTVKGVKSKSESLFLISDGVLELWRKNLREGRIPSPLPFERISLINFFSLVLPRGWSFRAFSHVKFCLGGQPFLPGGPVGILPPPKIPRGRAEGDVNSC